MPYDNEGRRVRKSSSSGAAATVVFVYDLDGHLMGECDQNGVALREYAWLGDMPVAVFTPDPANAANPPLIYFVHSDHLNTPRVVVDKAGNQRWNWLAEPFGTSAPNTNPQSHGVFTFNLRFPGQYADAESGLFYNYFRNYDSSIGRYSQSDPIGLDGGINTYVYVGGNPLSKTDPLGLNSMEGGGAARPPLIPMHPDTSLSPSSLDYWSRQSTDDIIRSLLPSRDEGLKVDPATGKIWDGNTRIKVVNVDALPRQRYSPGALRCLGALGLISLGVNIIEAIKMDQQCKKDPCGCDPNCM